jgi:hypothetical protein
MTATMLGTARRILVRLPVVLLYVGFLVLANCAGESNEKGPDCATLCERGMKECPGVPRVDCDSQCLFEDARAQESGCQKHVDAVASCSSELEDICTTATGCKPELDRFWACVNAWCADHPGSQFCAMPGG